MSQTDSRQIALTERTTGKTVAADQWVAITEVLNQVLVAPATCTVRGIPTEVVLGREDGTPEHCALNLRNIAAVPKGLLTERITRLGAGELYDALNIAAGCWLDLCERRLPRWLGVWRGCREEAAPPPARPRGRCVTASPGVRHGLRHA